MLVRDFIPTHLPQAQHFAVGPCISTACGPPHLALRLTCFPTGVNSKTTHALRGNVKYFPNCTLFSGVMSPLKVVSDLGNTVRLALKSRCLSGEVGQSFMFTGAWQFVGRTQSKPG